MELLVHAINASIMKRIKNAIKLFYWALKHPDVIEISTFDILTKLLLFIMKVAEERKSYMTNFGIISVGKSKDIVNIWAGPELDSSPTKRIIELLEENIKLKEEIAELLKNRKNDNSRADFSDR